MINKHFIRWFALIIAFMLLGSWICAFCTGTFSTFNGYSEYYLEVDDREYSFTEIAEPHKDDFGLDYQFQNLYLLSISDMQNYEVALNFMTSTGYVPLTEVLAEKIFKPIDNGGFCERMIDSANVEFTIVISPIYFGKIADGDYYCANVIIEDNTAYVAVYRTKKGINYITIYKAVDSEPIICLSKQINELCDSEFRDS